MNEKGGVLGRPIQFVIHDDGSDGKTAMRLYEKLITEDKVDAGTSRPAAPPPSAGIGRRATPAGPCRSVTTPAAIATARNARPSRKSAGSRRAGRSCCPSSNLPRCHPTIPSPRAFTEVCSGTALARGRNTSTQVAPGPTPPCVVDYPVIRALYQGQRGQWQPVGGCPLRLWGGRDGAGHRGRDRAEPGPATPHRRARARVPGASRARDALTGPRSGAGSSTPPAVRTGGGLGHSAACRRSRTLGETAPVPR
jgi:hypothetical protein